MESQMLQPESRVKTNQVGGMAYVFPGGTPVDYAPCRYGGSRLEFRGPFRPLQRGYMVALGGSETFGRDQKLPWPVLLEQSIGQMVVNLGLPNAGPDVYLRDPAIQDIAAGASLAIIQLPGAVNLSNRFYSVHPRRNDRVLRITPELHELYPEMDFIEFNFTNHLVSRLRDADSDRFELLHKELRAVWVARMSELLARLPARTVLVWLATAQLREAGVLGSGPTPTPALVDRAMVAAVAGGKPVLEIVVDPAGFDFGQAGSPAASMLTHRQIADAVLPLVDAAVGSETGARRRP